MRYMFLIYANEASDATAAAEARRAAVARHHAVMDEARARGVLRGADSLKPTTTATTLRPASSAVERPASSVVERPASRAVENQARSRAIITDGPFAETKEQLAGYYIIDCRDLDEAIEWARKIPTACQDAEGCVEIRPIQEMLDV
jgi:hypothetical protein